MDFAAEQVRRVVPGERRPAGVPVPLHDPPADGQQQGERQVGRGPVEDARRVPDRDAADGGGRHVDVVDAHPEVADHPDAGQPVEHGGVDGRVAVGVDGVEPARPRTGVPPDQLDPAGEQLGDDGRDG
jgi:hypothetical protein